MIRTVKDYEKLSEQYNKMLEERNSLIDDLSWYKAKVSGLEDEKDDMLLEREYYKNLYEDMTRRGKEMERENRFLLSRKDNLFDSWRDENKRSVALSKKLEQLEREIKEFDKDYEMVTNNCIYWEDKAHWLEDESSKYIDLLSEISQHIGNKPSSSTYKYFRGKLNALEIREDE